MDIMINIEVMMNIADRNLAKLSKIKLDVLNVGNVIIYARTRIRNISLMHVFIALNFSLSKSKESKTATERITMRV